VVKSLQDGDFMANKEQGMVLASNNWVNKSNALNEVRNNRMTISQIRLFTIYLSKINPKKIESREVTFRLEEYTKIMQFKQTNTTRLIKTAEDLLSLTVKFWDRTGEHSSEGLKGFVMCQLFKRFRLYKDEEKGEWNVSIDCHDDVVQLMFDLQRYYFKYELWNALQLTSPNQQRMYEILKQYEKIGERILSVKDLRELLGIKSDEYTVWQNFKKRVLDASQEALARYTDIKFTWEVHGKRGKGGKIVALKFIIEKNNDYIRQLTFDDFIIEQDETTFEAMPEAYERPFWDDGEYDGEYDDDYIGKKSPSPYTERIEFMMDACERAFTFEDMRVLIAEMNKYLTYEQQQDQLYCYHFLNDRYIEMKRQEQTKPIPFPVGYMKTLIGVVI
jgi:plasmid replication initiation protein